MTHREDTSGDLRPKRALIGITWAHHETERSASQTGNSAAALSRPNVLLDTVSDPRTAKRTVRGAGLQAEESPSAAEQADPPQWARAASPDGSRWQARDVVVQLFAHCLIGMLSAEEPTLLKWAAGRRPRRVAPAARYQPRALSGFSANATACLRRWKPRMSTTRPPASAGSGACRPRGRGAAAAG